MKIEDLTGEIFEALTPEQKKAIVKMTNKNEDAIVQEKVSVIEANLKKIADEKAEKLAAAQARKEARAAADPQKETKRERDLEKELDMMRTMMEELKSDAAAKEEAHKEENRQLRMSSFFDNVIKDFEFKGIQSKKAQEFLINSVKNDIFNSYTVEFAGNEMIFRDRDGEICRNKANLLQPFTLKELIKDRIDGFIMAKEEKVKESAGQGQFIKNDSSSDYAGVKTQVEADNIIEKQLVSEGLSRESRTFAQRMSEIRLKNNIQNLPLR